MKETPPSQAGIQHFDGPMRDQLNSSVQTISSQQGLARRPGELVWAVAREGLSQEHDKHSEFQTVSCLPMQTVEWVDILSEEQQQTIRQKIYSGGTEECPLCGASLLSDSIELDALVGKLSPHAKVIFAVSAKLLLQRDKLSFEVARDIYGFTRGIKDKKIIRIDSSSIAVDWYVARSFGVQEFLNQATDFAHDMQTFGEWAVFEATDQHVTLLSSEGARNYCTSCQQFFEYATWVLTNEEKQSVKIVNDQLVINNLQSLYLGLDNQTLKKDMPLATEFRSLIVNLRKIQEWNSKSGRQIKDICLVLASSRWLEYKEHFFKEIVSMQSPSDKHEQWNASRTSEISFNKLIEVGESDKLFEFFDIEEAIITLIASTEMFRKFTISRKKFSHLKQLLVSYPEVRSIQVFDRTVNDILTTPIKELCKSFLGDAKVAKSFELLNAAGLGLLTLEDSLLHLTSPEKERLRFLQTIFSERRRKTNRLYVLQKEDVEDFGKKAFWGFNNTVCTLLTSFQRGYLAGGGSKDSFYEFARG